MTEPMLFYTTVPILLGGSPRVAGHLAADIYTRHGISAHWYGRGWHLLLTLCAIRHPLSLPFSEGNDGILLRLLCDFEKRQRCIGGIPCLIPCSKEAALFLERKREILEERFVLLEHPEKGVDPLYRLVHNH